MNTVCSFCVLHLFTFTRNRLSSLPKLVFIKLSQLRTLELNKNRLVEIPGLAFHGLKNLRILKLKRNSLRFLMDGAFYGLESIEQLQLDRNQVLTLVIQSNHLPIYPYLLCNSSYSCWRCCRRGDFLLTWFGVCNLPLSCLSHFLL